LVVAALSTACPPWSGEPNGSNHFPLAGTVTQRNDAPRRKPAIQKRRSRDKALDFMRGLSNGEPEQPIDVMALLEAL